MGKAKNVREDASDSESEEEEKPKSRAGVPRKIGAQSATAGSLSIFLFASIKKKTMPNLIIGKPSSETRVNSGMMPPSDDEDEEEEEEEEQKAPPPKPQPTKSAQPATAGTLPPNSDDEDEDEEDDDDDDEEDDDVGDLPQGCGAPASLGRSLSLFPNVDTRRPTFVGAGTRPRRHQRRRRRLRRSWHAWS